MILFPSTEVFQGKGYGVEVDLWSLGIMLFEFAAPSVRHWTGTFGYPTFPDNDIRDISFIAEVMEIFQSTTLLKTNIAIENHHL